MESIETLIASSNQFYIKQKKEWLEILSGFESKNNYVIYNSQKLQLGYISEQGHGFFHLLKRLFLRSHRPFTIVITNNDGKVLLKLHRPFFWFFSDLFIEHESKKFGSIHRRFAFIYKTYTLYDHYQKECFTIKSPFWKLWTFPIYNLANQVVGVITKKWQGVLKEIFTDADAFVIDMQKIDLSVEQKVILFCAGLSIDFDFFEQNQGTFNLIDVLGQ